MKRDLDLARQLLFDIENRGTDCSVSVLRSGSEYDKDERVRHHLRLLIDANLLKEVDRTSTGIPCIRLTHEGHELIELARSESRWREAKWVCQERIGGLSLSVIRDILLRWAISGRGRYSRARRVYAPRPLRYVPENYYRESEAYRVEPYRYVDRLEERDLLDEPRPRTRYVRVETPAGEKNGHWGYDGLDFDGDGFVDWEYDSTLPPHLI